MEARKIGLIVLSPNGQRVAMSPGILSRIGIVRIWDTKSGVLVGTPILHVENDSQYEGDNNPNRSLGSLLGTAVKSIAFNANSTRLVTASADSMVRLWDTETGAQLGKPIEIKGGAGKIAFSPDGDLFPTTSFSGNVDLWDAQTGLPSGKPLQHEVFVDAPTDIDIELGDASDESISTEKTTNGKVLRGSINFLLFSPDGRYLATASSDKRARIWDVANGDLLHEPMKHDAEVTSIAFSRNGKYLVSSTRVGTICIWDAVTGKAIIEPIKNAIASPSSIGSTSLDDYASLFAISLDSSCLATASQENVVRLWDVETGAPMYEPMVHEQSVQSVAFSPDGSQVIAISNRMVYLWDIPNAIPKNKLAFINRFLAKPDLSILPDSEMEKAIELHTARRRLQYRATTAKKAIERNDWFAAKFHLPWLIEQEPNNPRWKKLLDEVLENAP